LERREWGWLRKTSDDEKGSQLMGCSPGISRGVSLLQDVAGDMEIRWGSCEEDLVLEGKTGI